MPFELETNGLILKTFERVSNQKKIEARRFEQIITNTADHLPFHKAGLTDCFTITCISNSDIETYQHYLKALESGVDRETLIELLSKAPTFEHYHQPTDTFDKLNESSIRMASATIGETILSIQMR
jgi:Peptidase family M28